MIKQVLILVGAAASTAALVAVVTLPGEAQQRPAQSAAQSAAYVLEKTVPPLFDSSYTAGMRIIHVPQANAAAPGYRENADEQQNIEAVPPKPQRRVTAPQPRRVLPPPGEPKRTMLDAPKALHDGPSPVRPLPRWREIEKFTELPKPVTASSSAGQATAPVSGSAAGTDPAAIDDDAPPPAD